MEITSLKYSTELGNVLLVLPDVPEEYLESTFLADNELEATFQCREKFTHFPLAAGEVIDVHIKDVVHLTKGEDVKDTIDIAFNISTLDFHFKPGDTVGIVPANPTIEVENILRHLGLAESALLPFKIHVKKGTKKKTAAKPLFIPEITHALHVLENCLEIRAPVKKLFVRILAEYASDSKEKRRLEELCSRQGAKEFSRFIIEARTSLLDILDVFPSCCPPITRLIEFLPRLLARPYSISSSPFIGPQFHITLSLLKLPGTNSSQERQGVCTGWLFKAAQRVLNGKNLNVKDSTLSQQLGSLSLTDKEEIKQEIKPLLPMKLFLRKSTDFSLPEDQSLPLILIGPGTGVAPFIGFLQHREFQKKQEPNLTFGDIWLFYGCRYEDRDYLYRELISQFLENGVLSKLFVAFSRDSHAKVKYVQDNIRLQSKQFIDQLLKKNGRLYVCGDAVGMAKDVLQTIVSVIQFEEDMPEQQAVQLLNDLKKEGRYLEDIWT